MTRAIPTFGHATPARHGAWLAFEGSRPSVGTSAIPVFVAGVSAEHDGGPAIPCVAGAAAHTSEAA
jgi:hypothetical protein